MFNKVTGVIFINKNYVTNCEKYVNHYAMVYDLSNPEFITAPASLDVLISSPESPEFENMNKMLLSKAKELSVDMQNEEYRKKIETLSNRKDYNG